MAFELVRQFRSALKRRSVQSNAQREYKAVCERFINAIKRDDVTFFLENMKDLAFGDEGQSDKAEMVLDVFQAAIDYKRTEVFEALCQQMPNYNLNRNILASGGSFFSFPEPIRPMLAYAIEKGASGIALVLANNPSVDIYDGGFVEIFGEHGGYEALSDPMILAHEKDMSDVRIVLLERYREDVYEKVAAEIEAEIEKVKSKRAQTPSNSAAALPQGPSAHNGS